mgnify:CR=1 FL=1
MLSRLLGEDVRVELRLGKELGLIKVDVGQFEQIVMNLAVNARDAMPRGGKLLIETANLDLDANHESILQSPNVGPHVLLRVTDTGCGISSEAMSQIFEPFFSTKGEMGTGLGLATVYGIVKQSGGRISVESQFGTGTTFELLFPRVSESSPQSTPSDCVAKPRGVETILLVEDLAGVRALARTALLRQGYQVLEAENGQMALQQSDRFAGEIGLLATDVVMPHMGGREHAEKLLLRRPQMKVLYMSGYMDDAIMRHGLGHSTAPFLQKPYTPESLVRKVREVLDG